MYCRLEKPPTRPSREPLPTGQNKIRGFSFAPNWIRGLGFQDSRLKTGLEVRAGRSRDYRVTVSGQNKIRGFRLHVQIGLEGLVHGVKTGLELGLDG
eukprot:686321-Amorphochlora_amoeboformis.AAC.1